MTAGRVAVAAAALLALAGCGSPSGTEAVTLNVSAASSLTEAFTRIADEFEADHPGISVALNFAGSSALAEQVNAGAPVDVLATASSETMTTVSDAGNAVDPRPFATNVLTIVVPSGNPAGVSGLADLSGSDVRTAICAPEVPCGAATAALLAATGESVDAVTLDPDVKSVLARVVADEVDAGIVYVTDARATVDKVDEVPIPEAGTAPTDYLVTRVIDSGSPDLADDFIALVTGPTGQQVLRDAGFGPS